MSRFLHWLVLLAPDAVLALLVLGVIVHLAGGW